MLTGGDEDGLESIDLLDDGDRVSELRGARLETRATHGTGCTFSAAVTARLARGASLDDAVTAAKRYVESAIRHAYPLGRGRGPLNHFWRK